MTRPPVIAHMAKDEADARIVVNNQEHIKNLPFDGVAIRSRQATERVMEAGTAIDEAALLADIGRLSDMNEGMHNMLLLTVKKPGELTDDDAWALAVDNWKVIAQVAKESGFKGILFDNEEYFQEWQDLPGNQLDADNLRELQSLASMRGREIMEAVNEVWDDAMIIIPHGPYTADPISMKDWFKLQYQSSPDYNELSGAFFTGFAEGKGANQTLVDGGELYRLRTDEEFKTSFEHRSYDLAEDAERMPWDIDPEVRANWAQIVSQGAYLYTDRYPEGPAGDPKEGDSPDNPATDHKFMSPEIMARTLTNAINNSEGAVVVYSDALGRDDTLPGDSSDRVEDFSFYEPGRMSQKWRDAFEKGIADADGSLPDTPDTPDNPDTPETPETPEVPQNPPVIETVVGTKKADVLTGTDAADEISALGGDDVVKGSAGADRIDGGDGVDEMDYSGSAAKVQVYLHDGGRGYGGDAQGDVLTDVENLTGSNHNDILFGNDDVNQIDGGDGDDYLSGKGGDDVIKGSAGADRVDGGKGADEMDYSGSAAGVQVYLHDGGRGYGGDAQGDVLTDVENLTGSNHDDTLFGNADANRIKGGKGDDYLSGKGGDDVLIGGAGADVFDGGTGTDTASYENSTDGVIANLADADAGQGDAAGDEYNSIENLTGGSSRDYLTGNNSANVISGGDGSDLIYGADGDDILKGGNGADVIVGGKGEDTLSYADAEEGVNASLTWSVHASGEAEGDWIFGVENLEGSSFDDILTGDHLDNILTGGDGADTFKANDHFGNDTIADFEDGVDMIAMTGNLVNGMDDISISSRGDDAVISDDHGNTLTVTGAADLITESDLLFG